jgi:hypothetical protein
LEDVRKLLEAETEETAFAALAEFFTNSEVPQDTQDGEAREQSSPSSDHGKKRSASPHEDRQPKLPQITGDYQHIFLSSCLFIYFMNTYFRSY